MTRGLVLDEVEARLPIPDDVLITTSTDLPSGDAWWSPRHRVVLVRDGLSPAARRWSLAHEAAHIALGHHGGMGAEIEGEADALAAVLMLAAQGAVVGLPDGGRAPGSLTAREAATALGVSPGRVLGLAQRGVISGAKVDGAWHLLPESVTAYARSRDRASRHEALPRIPAAPLLRQIDLRGGVAACGVARNSAEEKAIERARVEGTVTLDAADTLAVRVLGLTPWDLWGDDFYAA